MIAILLVSVLVLIVAVGAWAIWTFNQLVKVRNQQREGWSGIDVQLRKRHDLVPSLVATVQGYRGHERAVFESVAEARSKAAADPNRTDSAENALTQGLRQLLAIAEAYPELKADTNFRQLSAQLVAIEDDLQFARRYYNGSVRDFRNLVESFPSNLVAGAFGFQPGGFFEVSSATEREVPKVELS